MNLYKNKKRVLRLKRTIVIDSPGGWIQRQFHVFVHKDPGDESDDTIIARFSCNGKKNSPIIKPPSLVRIPYSFAAEHESEEDSSLSVESCTVQPPQSQPQCGIRQDAFPSPVVDVKKDTRDENERKDCETENGATAMMSEEFQGPRNFMGQQDIIGVVEECVLPPSQVVHVTETAVMQDTTEVDTGMMDTSEAAVDSDKTRLSVQQDTRDSTVGETETEVRQDEIVQQLPEPTSNAPRLLLFLWHRVPPVHLSQQQGDGGSDGISSSSGNSTVGQVALGEGSADIYKQVRRRLKVQVLLSLSKM